MYFLDILWVYDILRFCLFCYTSPNVNDLGRFARISTQSADTARKVAKTLHQNITAAANELDKHVPQEVLDGIGKRLNQRTSVTALHTTMILWLNSLLTQQRLHKQGIPDIPPVGDMRKSANPQKQAEVWRTILKRNWRAIFMPAIKILEDIYPSARIEVVNALELLTECVEEVETSRIGEHISIGAELFPMLSSDRKEAAAFYTRATTAELLAALTIRQSDLADVEWRDPELFKSNHVADLACGTGTLLRCGFLQILEMHEICGGTLETAKQLHRNAMEGGVVGTDISGIAAHLTTSAMTSAGPGTAEYKDTQIGWVTVCGEKGATGSLEYFHAEELKDNYHDTGGRTEGKSKTSGSVIVKDHWLRWVIMNPPYSRSTKKRKVFDVQDATDAERDLARERWGKITPSDLTNIKAGMASSYLALAKQKLQAGGRLGFVLPISAAFVPAWKKTRRMVERQFENILAIAIQPQPNTKASSMSADTGMEEMLLVGERRKNEDLTMSSEGPPSPITCVTLGSPPANAGESREIARAILSVLPEVNETGKSRRIMIGAETIGHATSYSAGGEGDAWSPLGVKNLYLLHVADQLAHGELLSPESDGHMIPVPMITIAELFSVGESHDLIGYMKGLDNRGAYVFEPIHPDEGKSMGEDRSLWGAGKSKLTNKNHQMQMEVFPTHAGIPNSQAPANAGKSIQRAKLFYARFMRWTSQCPLVATTRWPAMGGVSWASLKHENRKVETAFALWANSIYGMLVHWTQGSRVHKGRSITLKEAVECMPCPDLSKLSPEALAQAAADYKRLKNERLRHACLAHACETRKEINDAVRKMFGWPNKVKCLSIDITRDWCREPTVHGHNTTALKLLSEQR